MEPLAKLTPVESKLVEQHTGLVIHEARQRFPAGRIPDDVIAAGNLGLVEAARHFDASRGVKFVSYAHYWVRAFIIEYQVRSAGPVRFGSTRAQRHMFFNLNKVRRRAGDDDPGALAAGLNAMGEVQVSEEDVIAALPRIKRADVSMDATGAEQRGWHERLPDEGATPEEQLAEREDLNEQHWLLRRGLRALDERSRSIIHARYLRRRPKTFKELGKQLGISRERVRQIEARALKKLAEMV